MSLDDRVPATRRLVDSPFLPASRTQFAWDSVSLTSILSCPRRYYYSIIEGYQPKGPSSAIALTFGIAFHKALEVYHNQRVHLNHIDAVQATIAHLFNHDPYARALPTGEEFGELDKPEEPATDALEDDGIHERNSKVRTRYHLARAVVWYLENYADDPLTTHILPSGKPAVELSFRATLPFEVNNHPVLLCGHIDRVVSFNENLFVSDYKTTKSLTQQWAAMFDLSHQMTGYQIGGTVSLGQPTRGVWIDGIALQVGGVKFARHNTRRTPGQVAEYFDLVRYASSLSARFDAEDNYPLNTASCYFCDFKEVCRQAPEYRQQYLNMLFEKGKSWNPLESR